jgi:hypothetical protein
MVVLSLLYYWYALLFALVLGAPAFAVASRLKIVNFWSAVLVGAAVGGVVSFAVPSGMSSPYYLRAVGETLPLNLALGASAGVVFIVVLTIMSRPRTVSQSAREP